MSTRLEQIAERVKAASKPLGEQLAELAFDKDSVDDRLHQLAHEDVPYLLKLVASLESERDAYKKAAEEWMNDHDKLKAKYEPTEATYE